MPTNFSSKTKLKQLRTLYKYILAAWFNYSEIREGETIYQYSFINIHQLFASINEVKIWCNQITRIKIILCCQPCILIYLNKYNHTVLQAMYLCKTDYCRELERLDMKALGSYNRIVQCRICLSYFYKSRHFKKRRRKEKFGKSATQAQLRHASAPHTCTHASACTHLHVQYKT